MVDKLLQGSKKHLGLILIIGLLLVISIQNYTPGTWLAGWDNLLPELNIILNIKRSFNAVWQEYQGLGLVGGMGHAADLIRQLIIFPFVYLLPIKLIRYLWHFAMMALGTLGVYWGLGKLLHSSSEVKSVKVLGALFYLLNFGTIQFFWAPYEPFSAFWGFFPWLMFVFWEFLKRPIKKNFKSLLIVNLLAIPSFYVPTFFVVYLLCLSLIGLPFILKNKTRLFIKATTFVLLLNSFWLLPFVYYFVTNVKNTQLSITNIVASEETFLRNQKRGTIADFLLLRGYYYDFPDGETYLMETWVNHLSKTWVSILGYILGGIAILGLISLTFRLKIKDNQEKKWQIGLISIFCLGAIALLSATPPFSWLNFIFRQSLILDQIFRAPFTKFIVPAAFSFALLFAQGLERIILVIQKLVSKTGLYESIFRKRWISFVISLVFISIIFVYASPVFKGNFIYYKMRSHIPFEYFQLFQFFSEEPKNARIANLPQGNFWGWTHYRWGHRGSGFIWYGIEQPILDRAFDVWSLKNEQYYWELTYALQKQDLKQLEQIFDKYFIEFVIFDDNVMYTGEKVFAKQALKTKQLLDQSSRLKKVAGFGKIEIYRFDQENKPLLFSGEIPVSNPLSFVHQDPVYKNNGPYITDSKQFDIFYPFADLFTSRSPKENNSSLKNNFEIKEKYNSWTISRDLPEFLNENYLLNSNSDLNEIVLPIAPKYFQSEAEKTQEVKLNPLEFTNPHHCAPEKPESSIKFKNDQGELDFSANKAALCASWGRYDFFSQLKKPTLIEIKFDFLSSKDEWPQFCLWDENNSRCLNNKELPSKGFAKEWERLSEIVLFDPSENNIAGLTFILDAYQTDEPKAIKYKNIELLTYQISQQTLPVEIKSSYQVEKGGQKLLIRIPKVDTPFFTNNPIENNLFKIEPKNWESLAEGEFDLKFLEENGKKFIRLSSTENNTYFSRYFKDLPLDVGWLVEIEHRFKKGHQILASAVEGLNKYHFFYTKLNKNNDWQKAYFIIPPYSDVQKGIVLMLSNYSFSQYPSVNDIASVRIIPLNWDYLQSIHFSRKDVESQPKITSIESNNKHWFYTINLTSQKDENSFVVLPQAHDKGWVAFALNGVKPKFFKHVLVNNWANGWELNDLILNTQDLKLYIIFLPQLLEYLGFLILFVFGFLFYRRTFREKRELP